MSEVKVNKISPRSGTAITLGDSGDTFTIPSGATLAIAGSVTGFTSAGIDDNATSVAITIDSSESVGIGTTSPFNSRPGAFTISNEAPTIYMEDTNGTGNKVGQILYQNAELSYSTGSRNGTGTSSSTEYFRINSSGNVGIGTTAPGSELHVVADDVSQSWSPYDGTVLTIENNDTDGCILQTIGRNTATNEIWFGDDDSRNIGRIRYEHSNNVLEFWTNSSERMKLTDTGLSIGTTESSAPIDVKLSSSNTNSASNIMQIRHNTSGTAAAGFGTNIAFNGERADGNDQAMGKIGFVATNNTSTDMSSAFTIGTANAGVNAERMRVEPSGRVRIGNTSSTGHGNIYNLIVGNESSGGDAGVLIVSPNNENAYFGFGDDGGVPCSLNYNHGSNFLRTYVNGSEAMRIDSSGNVGIGETAPLGQLHVKTGESSSSVHASANELVVEGSANAGISILSGNSNEGAIYFGDDGNNDVGRIRYLHNTNQMDFTTNAGIRASITSAGNVGIGTTAPSVKLQVDTPTQNAHVTNIKISQGGWSNSINKLKSLAWGDPTTLGAIGLLYDGSKADMKWHSFYNGGYKTETTTIMTLTGTGNLSVSGSISKGSGSFIIDHPLPSKKETHNLVHSFVEAPQADNIYRGKIDLVNGTATINIDTNSEMSDGTFVLLNREIQCFTSNETGWTAVKGSVSGNTLTITAQDNTCDDTISWMVIGERQDQHMYDTEWTDENGKVIVEPLKETETTTP